MWMSENEMVTPFSMAILLVTSEVKWTFLPVDAMS